MNKNELKEKQPMLAHTLRRKEPWTVVPRLSQRVSGVLVLKRRSRLTVDIESRPTANEILCSRILWDTRRL